MLGCGEGTLRWVEALRVTAREGGGCMCVYIGGEGEGGGEEG